MRQRWGTPAWMVLLVVVVCAAAGHLTRPADPFVPLYPGGCGVFSRAMTGRLDACRIPYRLESGHLEVPSRLKGRARLALAAQGWPDPRSPFCTGPDLSSYDVSQGIRESVLSLATVADASVRLPQFTYVKADDLRITLTLHPGSRLRGRDLTAIAHMAWVEAGWDVEIFDENGAVLLARYPPPEAGK